MRKARGQEWGMLAHREEAALAGDENLKQRVVMAV